VSLDGRLILLGAAKQRALLAMLALRPNERVSARRLIEGLWGEEPPASAPKMVQLYVSQLRKLLEGNGSKIVTRGGGYELRLPADAVDAVRFERLVTEATHADATSSPLAREALALWRGSPLDDISDEPFAILEIRRLEELRLRARELAIDAALAVGEHRAVIGELDVLVAERSIAAVGRPRRWRPSATPADVSLTRWGSSPAPSCATCTRRCSNRTPRWTCRAAPGGWRLRPATGAVSRAR
jgi:DNA-binding SARP family transcriptional activator